MKSFFSAFIVFTLLVNCTVLSQDIPKVHRNIIEEDNTFIVQLGDKRSEDTGNGYMYSITEMLGSPSGTETGISFHFQDTTLSGKLYYGFIPEGDSKYPHPVYFRSAEDIVGGTAEINILGRLRGLYDMVNWQETGKGKIGYRVTNAKGSMLYDGVIRFKGKGPFEIDDTIIEGPYLSNLTSSGVTVWYRTNNSISTSVEVGEERFKSKRGTYHEVDVVGLDADKEYEYKVNFGDNTSAFTFRTAPAAGSRSKFSFTYASDSRAGNGGGERNIYGANSYIMKKIMALNRFKDARFMQFSGDLINGYVRNTGDMRLQYANWKRAVGPWWHYIPINVSMGNHEALNMIFTGDAGQVMIDRFPYETESSEAIFADEFVNPLNGPEGEDGAEYDPDPKSIDFPSYKENVFYYTYDNVAVVVLNSDYWYAPTSRMISRVGGGLHGYIMDNQLKWFEETLKKLEDDSTVDHVFVTLHTPFFPNGGHTRDDMWYSGNNQWRPWVAGKGLTKGIIERRDQLLDIMVNQTSKTIGILTGDEHNYARTEIGPETNIYPDVYLAEKIELSRTIYQINNGAAGAPYYAQEETPWTPQVSGFTTQNALVFFHIEGESIEMEVLNPDTLEEVDNFTLR